MNEYAITHDNELRHYGVKGMKWGIRRYQNSDGTLTSVGKKRARQEYRSDNKTAYELGKNATISGRAAAQSMKRTIKLENKLDKQIDRELDNAEKPVSRRSKSLIKRYNASKMTTAQLTMTYMNYKTKAEQHCKSLIDKYGQEAVSAIKYKDVKLPKGQYSPDSFNTINERTNNLSDYARAGAQSIASVGISTMLGAPVAVIFSPKTTYEKARDLEMTTYYANRKNQKRS